MPSVGVCIGLARVLGGDKDWADISEGPAENLAHAALKESWAETG